MSTTLAGPPSGTRMTIDEFLDLPDDGIHHELIRGVVKTYPSVPSWQSVR